ncbi:MAG: pseudouridylate synthase [Cyclobacteriaceae bacterium]
MLEILYQDEHIVAINKPSGLVVHRSAMAANTDEFALQILRDQMDQKVYPAHRLDRKTSGVLLFALNKETLSLLMKNFAENKIRKEYLAIVRGYTEDYKTIDYALKDDNGKEKEAVTDYITLDRCELDVPFGKHNTSRYSLVKALPKTGRMHQLRKHFAHILHPIIGDRPHGCNKQNKLFLERWGLREMLLHARSLYFDHPVTKQAITLTADLHPEFLRMKKMMGFDTTSF